MEITATQAMELAKKKVFLRRLQENGNTYVFVPRTINELIEYIDENKIDCKINAEVQNKEFIDLLLKIIIKDKDGLDILNKLVIEREVL